MINASFIQRNDNIHSIKKSIENEFNIIAQNIIIEIDENHFNKIFLNDEIEINVINYRYVFVCNINLLIMICLFQFMRKTNSNIVMTFTMCLFVLKRIENKNVFLI